MESQIFRQVTAQVHEDVLLLFGMMKMKDIAKDESNISYDCKSNVFYGTIEAINKMESRISKIKKQCDDEHMLVSSRGQGTSQASLPALMGKQQSGADSEYANDTDHHLPDHTAKPHGPGADKLFTSQQQCDVPENEATVGRNLSPVVSIASRSADPVYYKNKSPSYNDRNIGQTQQLDGAGAQSKCSSSDTQDDLLGGTNKPSASRPCPLGQAESQIVTNQLANQIPMNQLNVDTAPEAGIRGQYMPGATTILMPNANDAEGSSQGDLGNVEGASPTEIQRSTSRIDIELHIWRYICIRGMKPENVEIDESSLPSGLLYVTECSKGVHQSSRKISQYQDKIREIVDFRFIELKLMLNKLEEIRTILSQTKLRFPDGSFWLEEQFADPQIVVANDKTSPTTEVFDVITRELQKIIPPRRRNRAMKNDPVEKTFALPTGPRIHCFPGNITCLNVDAIISSADSMLSNAGGVSKAIALAAGSSFLDDCKRFMKKRNNRSLNPGSVVVTNAHQLPCKHVIHIVTAHDSSKQELVSVFTDALSQANRLKLSALAVPSVGANTMRLKKEEIAETLVYTLLTYCQQNTCLTDILLVDLNEEMPRLFGQQLAKNMVTQKLDLLEKPAFSAFFARDDESKPPILTRQMSGQRGEAAGGAEVTKWGHETCGFDQKKSMGNAGQQASKPPDNEGTCCICMDTITNIRTLPCKHTFCKDCIGPWFKQKPSCPNCGEIFGPMTGNQPDGTMTHCSFRSKLLGYEWDSSGTIEINYNFPSGIQKENHPNPGVHYKGDRRTAYLPDNPEGRDILRLLEIAFKSKILFTIGRSVTTGREDRITWNDVHHKTKQTGGASKFGYPDDTYLKRVREELAAKGVK